MPAKHTDCGSCHQPHAFAAPTCASCHKGQVQRGAHAVPEHQPCGRCHVGHARATVGRGACLACHEDRRDHHPENRRCQACHPFDS
jgi:hypothetical protein